MLKVHFFHPQIKISLVSYVIKYCQKSGLLRHLSPGSTCSKVVEGKQTGTGKTAWRKTQPDCFLCKKFYIQLLGKEEV